MLQYTDINIPINKVQPVGIPGRFVYYLAGSAGGLDQTIKIRSGNTGGSTLLKPGQAFRLAEGDKTVDTFYVENYANAATIVGTLVIGDGEFSDNRISGSVEVIDGGKARTLANITCVAIASQGGVAGQNSMVQLWNPAGSSKNLIMKQVVSVSQTSQGFYHLDYNVALTTLLAGPRPKKLGAGYTGPAQIRGQNNAAILGAAMLLTNGPTSVSNKFRPDEPFVIPPGWGYIVAAQALAADVSANFEWYEESL